MAEKEYLLHQRNCIADNEPQTAIDEMDMDPRVIFHQFGLNMMLFMMTVK